MMQECVCASAAYRRESACVCCVSVRFIARGAHTIFAEPFQSAQSHARTNAAGTSASCICKHVCVNVYCAHTRPYLVYVHVCVLMCGVSIPLRRPYQSAQSHAH